MSTALEKRTISGHCDPDPIGDWIVDLLHDAHEGRPPRWPTRSKGLQELLPSSRLERGRGGAAASETPQAQDLQEALRQRVASEADAPSSAVCLHRHLQDLICAAQGAICTPDWFLDPTQAVVICADGIEARKVEAMLSHDYEDPERNEDQLSSARWVAESLMAPSPEWRYSGTGPVVLASEIPPGAVWDEVFLSPGCRGFTADQLLPAVGAAQVGVHVVAEASGH